MRQYKRLSFIEREEISRGIWANESFDTIATRLGRNVSTISREVHGQVKKKRRSYHAVIAQTHAQQKRGLQARKRRLDTDQRLRGYVYEQLRQEWSPEEIARRIKLEYPSDMTMRISHETIYQHLYCLPRGELK